MAVSPRKRALERAEAALKVSEHRLRTVVAAAPVVLWAIDCDGRFTLSEGRGLEVLGLAPGEVVGTSVWDLYAGEPEVLANLRRALAGESFTALVEVGDLVFESRFTPLIAEDGRQDGVIGVSTDVTDRVRAEAELRAAGQETIRRLALAVEARSAETGGHIDRVSRFCELIARRLELDDERCELIRLATPMHDVGKIAVPDAVLLKPGPLTAAERAVMERHAEVGHSMLAGSGGPLSELAAEITLTHHERYDGRGYPHGRIGDEIPLEGRIAAVGDVFDALTHDRVYRPAIELDCAVEMMRDGRGTQFDPTVLDAFLEDLAPVEEIEARHPAVAAG